ncbi:MAG TPA: tetratricopeptide repeat protein [Nitrospiraceae bacterium]|nr:tetratricopeptide repeat protein [Nitrospiraceae bacterium]
MNRAERKKQEKRRGPQVPGHLQQTFAQAVAHHQAGRLQQAEDLYRQILAEQPRHADSLHLLGLVAYKAGRLEEAAGLIADAIQQDSTKAPYCFNLGVVLQKQGKLDEAADAYRRAVKLNPSHLEAQSNLGNVLLEQGKLDQAVAAYQQALRLNPNSSETHNNLGVALKEQGKFAPAVASYAQALKLNSHHVEAQNNLGVALRDSGKLDEAVAAFTQTLALRPGYVKAHYDRAFAYLWQGKLDRAAEELRASAETKQNHGWPVQDTTVSRARMKHDAEQVQYLLDRGLLGQAQKGYLDMLRQLRQRAAQGNGSSWRMPVSPGEYQAIAPSFNRILHAPDCPQLADGAVSSSLDVAVIEARYHAKRPEIMHVDGLLTEDALQSIRRFCLESTIWKRDYPNGYIGAFLGDGFACPLLLQIAEELRLKFPGVFAQHKLTQAWAFKYDSALTGLNMHADAAAVNVNFWITPDAANLDPDRGGLVVWDREAPRDWSFKEYNNARNEPKVVAWLKQQGAQAVTIPYRCNRAVIFNSDLFHATDRISFKEGYENRRVNITLLYGRREQG